MVADPIMSVDLKKNCRLMSARRSRGTAEQKISGMKRCNKRSASKYFSRMCTIPGSGDRMRT